jgi:hypothetical protein
MSRPQRHFAMHRQTQVNTALPKFWRPKLSASVRTTAQIIHWDLVNRMADGSAATEDLWDWIETGFTYSQMARMLVEDGVEFTAEAMNDITAQLDIYQPVIDRLRNTGRIGFDAEQLRIARAAANVMDALIELDRHGIAERAALWSVQQMTSMRRRAEAA